MGSTTRVFTVIVDTIPKEVLSENPDRASYYILNQDAAVSAYTASGRSEGPHVAVAGNHEGYRLAPNGGHDFDNDDKDCVWMVAPATNAHIHITETIKSFHTIKGDGKR